MYLVRRLGSVGVGWSRSSGRRAIIAQKGGFHNSVPSFDTFTIQDDKDFKEKVTDNKKPVVVEFYATWCGPCKLLMPRLEKAMIKYNETVDLAKVDIDQLPDIALEYNIGAVPSVLLTSKGQMKDKFVGLLDEDKIDTFICKATKL